MIYTFMQGLEFFLLFSYSPSQTNKTLLLIILSENIICILCAAKQKELPSLTAYSQRTTNTHRNQRIVQEETITTCVQGSYPTKHPWVC